MNLGKTVRSVPVAITIVFGIAYAGALVWLARPLPLIIVVALGIVFVSQSVRSWPTKGISVAAAYVVCTGAAAIGQSVAPGWTLGTALLSVLFGSLIVACGIGLQQERSEAVIGFVVIACVFLFGLIPKLISCIQTGLGWKSVSLLVVQIGVWVLMLSVAILVHREMRSASRGA